MSKEKDVLKDLETQKCNYENEKHGGSFCDFIKTSSIVVKLSFAAVLIIVLACIALIISFVLHGKNISTTEPLPEDPPHEWFLTRKMWEALPYHHNQTTAKFDPIKLVVVHHTVSQVCATFTRCAAEIRALQRYFLNAHNYDIPYSFLIGNDGRIYEGRGWGVVGAERADFNRCTLLIAFIGDYRAEEGGHTEVTESQLNRTRMLLDKGVELGHLRKDFKLIGAKDIMYTESPGSILHEAIQKFEEFDHETNYRGLTCEIIYDMEHDTEEPGTWFIGREMWEAREVANIPSTEDFDPLMLVVIQHTVTTECFSLSACSNALRNLQTSALNTGHLDILYNFVIGNDGRVYEGRGWGKDGAQRFDFNRCSLNIGFIGDYREEIEGHTKVSELQLNKTRALLYEGVELGHLRSDFYVVGAKDLMFTASPGSNLYNAIMQWDEYDYEHRFRDLTCEEIYELYPKKKS